MSSNPISSRVFVNIEDEMQRSYLDYAMSVIVGRALPDARDGLKPVHRRVLFAMHELGNEWNKPYKKSARVVGDVIGKYHPHGDVAVYDTIVRMAQSFSLRALLVDGQGNFGSVDGDAPAAMRYTEVRMSRLAYELLADLDKETVDFGPNYDGSLQEPLILPCKFPNLLVNGSSGIAVGMATNIPSHNLGEVIDATIALIDDPLATVRELMRLLPGPDFPTGGAIHGRSGILSGYVTGRGSVLVRSITAIETSKEGREAIIVKELPYQVNKARLVERIAELVREKKVVGISDLRDESDREGMRVVIEIRRDANSDVVLNQLFKHTPMQSTFGINTLALVNGRPEMLNLKQCLEVFIRHRREVVTRRTLFELRKARERAHLLEGLAVALANIDRIIVLIRQAATPQEAKEGLLAEPWRSDEVEALVARAMGPEEPLSDGFQEGHYRLSKEQAQAILDMRLQRLTGLEQDKIVAEFAELLEEIARLRAILASDERLKEVIKGELRAIKEQFADPRRTRLVEDAGDFSIEDLISEQSMVVTVSHEGYIKRQPSEDYRAQRRGGKGKSATGVRDEDFIEQLFVASTHDFVLCFTDQGRVFRLKVHEIPQASRTSRGKALINLLSLEGGEKVRQILPVPVPVSAWGGWDLLFATGRGLIKKTALSAFIHLRGNGIRAIQLMAGDSLVGVALLPAVAGSPDDDELEEGGSEEESIPAGSGGESPGFEEGLEEGDLVREGVQAEEGSAEERAEEPGDSREPGRIMLFSAVGKAVRFQDGCLRRTGRTARGVRGMRLRGEDQVIALTVLEPGCQVLTLTENGFGKRTMAHLFPTRGRGGQGVIGMLTGVRNGPVVGVLTVWPEDEIILVTNQGKMLRTTVSSIRLTGRSTQGVTVLNVAKGERVASVARTPLSDEVAGSELPVEQEFESMDGSSEGGGMAFQEEVDPDSIIDGE